DPAATIVDVFALHGFAPTWADDGSGSAELLLGRCPFGAAVAHDAPTICSLHLGISEGVAAVMGPLCVDALEPSRSPGREPCRLHLRNTRQRVTYQDVRLYRGHTRPPTLEGESVGEP